MKLSYVIALLVRIVLADYTIGSFNSNLDPGRISWWRTQWNSSPIQVDNDNAGYTNTLTFNIRITHGITNGVIEVSGSTLMQTGGDFTVSSGIATATKTFTAGSETSVSLAIATTSPGMVGPFKIVTRHHAGGQIVDANFAFGSVYITKDFYTDNTLQVADIAAVSAVSPNHGASIDLSFAFDIDFDLWPHDLIIITAPSQIVPSTVPQCSSIDTDTNTNDSVVVNNLCSSTSDATCELKCETIGQEVIIYGFNKFLKYQLSDLAAKITVQSFTLPSADYAGYMFSWQIDLKRFGSNTTLKRYTGTGPSTLTKISPGSITCTSSPHRGLASTKLFNGMSIYMDFSCVPSTAIPSGGTLTATFAGMTLDAFADDGTVSCVTSGTSCSVSSPSITLTLGAVAASETVTFTTYSTFSATSSSMTVGTYDGIRLIDEAIATTVTMSPTSGSSDNQATFFEVNSYTSNTGATPDNESGKEVAWIILMATGVALDSNDSISVKCPINTSLTSNTKFFIGSSNVAWKHQTISDSGSGGFSDDNPNISGGSTPTVSLDTDSVAVERGNFLAVTAARAYALGVYVSGGSRTVTNPLVSRNKATFYECHATITEGTNTYTGVGVFDVNVATFISAGVLCTTKQSTGVPIVVRIVSATYAISNTGYQIVVNSVNANFGLGVASATATGWRDGHTPAVTVDGSTMTVANFGAVSAGSSADIYLPKGDDAGDNTLNVQLLYNSNGVDHVLASGTASLADGTTDADFSTVPTLTLTSEPKTVGDTVQIVPGSYTDTGGADILGLGDIPPYWDLSSSSFSSTVSANEKSARIFSNDPDFLGQTIFGIGDSSMHSSTNSFDDIIITSENESAPSLYNVRVSNLLSSCAGRKFDYSDFSINPGAFTSTATSPTTTKAKGPGVLQQTVTVNFTPANKIPNGGKIVILFSDFWTLPEGNSNCSISGASEATAGTSVNCTISSQTAEITQFAEIAAVTAITVTITDAYPKSEAPRLAGDCIISITSYNKQDKMIDESTSIGTCSSTAPDIPGKSTFASDAVVLYPNAQGRVADIYMSFSVDKELLPGSIIKISHTQSIYGTSETCFSSIKYTSCTMSDSELAITTSELIAANTPMEFYFDSAVYVTSTSGDFSVSTEYSGVTLTDDSSYSNKFTVTFGSSGGDITDGSIEATIKNPGEVSNYLFKFTAPADVSATDTMWVIFPMTYDPNIGETVEYTSGVYEIACTSSVFTSAVCMVNHWMVIVSGLTSLEMGSMVDLTIESVKNPAATSEYFRVFHLDGTTVLAGSDLFYRFIVETEPSNLSFRSVEASNVQLGALSDYTFMFYIDQIIEDLDEVIAVFPVNYDVESNTDGYLDCSMRYVNERSSSSFEIDSTITRCAVENNRVTWKSSSALANYVDLDLIDRVELVIENCENSQWGYSRTTGVGNSPWYDVHSTAISEGLFTDYTLWTSQFEILFYDASEKSITHRSFTHMTSAYIGLEEIDNQSVEIQIGSYDPITMSNRIIVNVGQMSATISATLSNDVPLLADSLTVVGLPDTLFLHSDGRTDTWKLGLLDSGFDFRVVAPTGTATGIYYIEFYVQTEIHENCHSSDIYRVGPRVLVEVQSATSSVSVPSSVTIYADSTSYPIPFSISEPSAADLSVLVDFGSNGSKLSSPTLEFSAGETIEYLIITSGSISPGTYSATLSLSGTDSSSYQISSSLQVVVASAEPNGIPGIVITSSNVASNTATFTITGGLDGTCYFFMKCTKESTGYVRNVDLDEMKEQLPSAGLSVSSETSLPFSTSLFNQYLKDLASQACYTDRYWSKGHTAEDGSIFEIDWLLDGQEYLAIAYVESSTGLSISNSARINTISSSKLKRFTVVATSTTNVAESSSQSTVACQLADRLRIPTYLLYTHSPTSAVNEANSNLTDSSFVFDLMYNRLDSSNNPDKFTGFLNSVETLENDIKTALGLVDSNADVSLTFADLDSSPAPSIGSSLPREYYQGVNSITFTWTTDNAGLWCTACVPDSYPDASTRPDSQAVAFGLSAGYSKANFGCLTTIADNTHTITIEDLTSGSKYYCYHVFCNENPILPTCRDITTTSSSISSTLDFARVAAISILFTLIFS